MTAKRFKVYKVIGSFHEWSVEDTIDDKVVFGSIMHKYEADRLCDKLNELAEENEQLKQLLDYADDLIQSHLSEHYIRQWRNFKTGHKEYNDFWEEKLKKHKELKEDME